MLSRLYRKCRPGGHYDVSLEVLARAKQQSLELGRGVLTKTGIMLGLGEERDELIRVFDDWANTCALRRTTCRWSAMCRQRNSPSSDAMHSH